MKKRDYIRYSGLLFLVVVALHLLRIFLGWDAVMGGWDVPLWVSWVAVVVVGYLAYSAYKLKN